MNLINLKIKLHKLYRKQMERAPGGQMPGFMIIGAQKAGTTSLHSMLIKHPKLKGGSIKEVHFFDRDKKYAKGLEWYRSHFKTIWGWAGQKRIFFDATPEYMFRPETVCRIKSDLPKIKLIVILREPTSRAFSAWNFFKKIHSRKHTVPSFSEAVQREIDVINGTREEDWLTKLGIVRRGFYFSQLQFLEKKFNSNQILILKSEDLITKPKKTLNKILEFLDIKNHGWNTLKKIRRNAGVYKNKINDDDKRILDELYENENNKLKEIYTIQFDH